MTRTAAERLLKRGSSASLRALRRVAEPAGLPVHVPEHVADAREDALYRAADAVEERSTCVRSATQPRRARTHRHRQQAAVCEGGGGLRPPAGGRDRGARPYRPALRRRALAGLLRRARRCRGRTIISTSAAARTRRRRPACWRRSSRCSNERGPTCCSSTATRTRRSPARSPARRHGVPVAHVEAGMRSYDRTMPEELNRVLADHASSLLLCSSERAAETLRGEQVVGEVVVVGDVMVDVAQLLAPRARERTQALGGRGASSRATTCSPPPTARGTWTIRRGSRRLVDVAARGARPGRAPAAPAHAGAPGRLRPARAAGVRRPARAAARLPRLHGAAPARPRRC